MKSKGQRNKNIDIRDISASNLTSEFTIENPRDFIREMRRNFFRKARKSKGLSLDEVVNKTGVSVESIREIEKGRITEQQMMDLHALAELYNLDYFRILNLYKLANNKPDCEEFGLAAYHKQDIDDEAKAELLEFIKSLKDA